MTKESNLVNESPKVKPIITRAELKDFRQFFIDKQGFCDTIPTTIAWKASLEGKTIGIGGFQRVDSRWVIFYDFLDEAKPFKKLAVQMARFVISEGRKCGIMRVYALPDTSYPLATKWLQRLGFRLDRNSMIYFVREL